MPFQANTDYINTEPTSATFLFGGTQMGHTYRVSSSVGGKFDFTTQINNNHEISNLDFINNNRS